MTLILTHLNRSAVWQVADRLVSVREGRKTTPFDSLSNKTVVYDATDGYAAISYVGLAYLEGKPTDQWLAELLRGKPVQEREHRKPWTHVIGPAPTQFSLGLAIKEISSSLERLPESDSPPPAGEAVHIVVAGWQLYRRKRARPFATGIRYVVGEEQATAAALFERHIGGRSDYLNIVPDNHLGKGLDERLLHTLHATPAEEREELLVQGLRLAARRDATVGTDATAVLLPHPDLGWGRVSFHPLRKRKVALEGTEVSIHASVAYSPWIVTRSEMLAPSVCIGDSTHDVGPIRLVLKGEVGTSVVFARSSQRRPKPP